MSSMVCGALELTGGLYESWQNFKLLKKRERIKGEIARCGDSEEVLNLLVEAREAQNQMRDVLKFWTVYAFLIVFELYLEVFVFWVPFYYSVKFFLLVWIIVAKGANSVFDHVVGPQLDKRAAYIDGVALPAVQSVVLSGQKAFLSGFVAASTFAASDAQLADLQDHLEEMQRRIDTEQNRRSAKAVAPPLDDMDETDDFIASPASLDTSPVDDAEECQEEQALAKCFIQNVLLLLFIIFLLVVVIFGFFASSEEQVE
ncbi:Receptor expression-enhancing protein 6 [Hondaea fermentalgiana]|uniref:Receptor expression-enhancing protein 6 n=1 Tax=Hondaea fermentalgiana TaxID=2315210 RepID=A0A2R5GMS6_9STRA|nr:Receptor expression-enhancing protein 6 [Hondaea fermentalgiana]|eukprot:GBG32187.1 Receptor expression-enhancing protein 6 [Hondaea fermentalgiana]